MLHEESHPLAGKTVTVEFAGQEPHEFVVEDWWDKVAGRSWMFSDGNPAALGYAMRSGFAGLPLDDEVVYGKVGGLGHIVHVSEFREEVAS